MPNSKVRHIYMSNDHLTVVTKLGGDQIKIFDPQSDDLIDRIQLTKVLHGTGVQSPYVISFHEDGKRFVLAVSDYNCFSSMGHHLHILTQQDGHFEYVGTVPCTFRLRGADADHYYFTETVTTVSNNLPKATFEPRRMDKTLINESSFHFEGKKLIVADTWEEGNSIWFLCFLTDIGFTFPPGADNPSFSGQLVLVAKDKTSGKVQELDSGETIGSYSGVSDEGEDIWIFDGEKHKNNILRYSKADKTFEVLNIPNLTKPVTPIKHGTFAKSSGYLWVYEMPFGGYSVYRIDKRDLSFTRVQIPENLRINPSASYSDDEYVWIGASKFRKIPPLMREKPYLVKVRKNDLVVEEAVVKPTFIEAVATFGKSGWSGTGAGGS